MADLIASGRRVIISADLGPMLTPQVLHFHIEVVQHESNGTPFALQGLADFGGKPVTMVIPWHRVFWVKPQPAEL